jgi:hypothetical protein
MPITPFHFGPGALFASAAPSRISWTVFALANVLIDLEPIGLHFITGDPAHPWLHTVPGALVVAAVAALVGRIDLGVLHAGCVIAGVAGIAILAIRRHAANGKT